jgi:hypothetical protein
MAVADAASTTNVGPFLQRTVMLPRAALVSLLTLVALAAPALGQGKLQWKFKEGDKFFLEEKIVAKSATVVGSQKLPFEQTQTRFSALAVKKATGDSFELEQRIESWTMLTVGNLAGAEEGAKLLEEIAKDSVFTIQMKLSGEITAFKGADDFMQKLAARDKLEAAKFEEIGGKEILRSMVAFVFDVLPAASVKKGEPWKKEMLVPMGPLGDYKYSMTYTEQDKGATTIKGTIAFQPSKAGPAGVEFKVVKMELAGEISGKMLFDAAKGRLTSTEWTVPRTGTVTVERQGEQSTVNVDGTEIRTIRLLDKRP